MTFVQGLTAMYPIYLGIAGFAGSLIGFSIRKNRDLPLTASIIFIYRTNRNKKLGLVLDFYIIILLNILIG